MARNEEKFKYTRLSLYYKPAQSALEYALIFPILFLMILGIWELAFMWHQYNSMEMVLQEINANLATLNVSPCSNPDLMQSVIRDKSSYLHLSKLDFTRKKDGSIYTFTSKQKYNSKPFIEARVDCSAVVKNGDVVPVVQLKSMHRLMFFSAKIPNLRPGAEPIEIIPSSVDFVSSKSATVREY